MGPFAKILPGTHEFEDMHVQREMDGSVLVNIEDFAARWILPSHGRWVFDSMVNLVLQDTEDRREWVMPGTFHGRDYLPWVAERMWDVRCYAQEILEHCLKIDTKNRIGYTGAMSDRPPAVSPADLGLARGWLERLNGRVWGAKPNSSVEDTATRSVDIALTGSPNRPERWDSLFVLGGYRHQDSESCRREVTIQLAAQAGKAFGMQPFRHYIHGFSLLGDQIQLWIFDRSGCFASRLINVSTDKPESRRAFIELVLAFSVMDNARLGFDPRVYGDADCTAMWAPPAAPPGSGVTAFIRVSGEVFQLNDTIFIRSGVLGRGTRCFSATLVSNRAIRRIVKMSWRSTDSCHEGIMLERAKRDDTLGICRFGCRFAF